MWKYIRELFEKLSIVEILKNSDKESFHYDEGMQMLVEKFLSHKRKSAKVFFIGNGGSCAIASHMTADFMKNGGMRTCSLYESAVSTCMGNDFGYEYIFSRPLKYLMQPDDLLVAISSSGNSPNIINAVSAAKQNGASVITFTGFKPDNKVKQMGDLNVYVPSEKYGIVESIHNMMLQQIVDTIMELDRETKASG